jgi:hypothetical protein
VGAGALGLGHGLWRGLTCYRVVVDGQMKTEFKTKDGALKAARDLKSRIPRLQVKVYDAEAKRSEEIELPAA